MESSIVGYMSHILMDDDDDGGVFIPCHSIQEVEQELENLLRDTSLNEFSHQVAGHGGGQAYDYSQGWEINSKNWADNLLRELEIEEDDSNTSLTDSYASSGTVCFSPPSSINAYLDRFIDEERKSLERWYDRELPISPCNSATDQLHVQGLSLSSPMGKYGPGQVSIRDLASPPANEPVHAHDNSWLRSHVNMAYQQQTYILY